MRKKLPALGYYLLGLLGLLALLCALAASGILNENRMLAGFNAYADTAHLGVTAAEYPEYAHGLTEYLSGTTQETVIRVAGESRTAFSEKENRHLQDVKNIVSFLSWMRWIGGGCALAAIGGLYLPGKKETRGARMSGVLGGFAWAAITLLALAAALAVWGLIDFQGLFWRFHEIAFANDLWLLDPQTDLLVALMPLQFFVWYAGELLKSLLPVLGIMLCVIFAHFKFRDTPKPSQDERS